MWDEFPTLQVPQWKWVEMMEFSVLFLGTSGMIESWQFGNHSKSSCLASGHCGDFRHCGRHPGLGSLLWKCQYRWQCRGMGNNLIYLDHFLSSPTLSTGTSMDDVPPPTEHILRPHHVGLLTILVLTFKELISKTVPPPFTLHLYRELLNEISEACLITRHPAYNCWWSTRSLPRNPIANCYMHWAKDKEQTLTERDTC
jgi:hypothetical protein